jgi:hypothetical protein
MACRRRRSSIALPLAFAILLLADCAIALTPAVHDAREMARRAVCTNNVFMPTGAHFGEIVVLDRDGNITEVSSCPDCAVPEGFGILFAEFYREGPGFERIPRSMIPAAIQQAATAPSPGAHAPGYVLSPPYGGSAKGLRTIARHSSILFVAAISSGVSGLISTLRRAPLVCQVAKPSGSLTRVSSRVPTWRSW